MVADALARLSSNDIIVIASLLFIAAAIAVWRLNYVERTPKVDAGLTDGTVLMLSDGLVRQVSTGAEALLGNCTDVPIDRVLSTFLGSDRTEAHAAVRNVELTGEPLNMLVRTAENKTYELIGTPAGAMIRIVLRESGLLESTIEDANSKVVEAERALQTQDWARATMETLVGHAPIIVWNRMDSGEVNWSAGEIRTLTGSVSAEQAVDLIVARTRLNRQPVVAGSPQKSRIEIVVNDGVETVSLHVIEIVQPNGERIGLATDAGTAASAERTLTRFVQTMTETFAHLTVGLAIFDRNQTLALFNPALVQMWQVEPAWLARRPSLRDIIDELRATRRLPELQDFHKWRSRLMNLFENTEAADYEELWHLADGSNIRVLARPHPHGSLAFIFDDVTERMRLEQRYRHSIDLRRATLDGLNDGIAVFGANGLLQFVNQAFHEIWGTDAEQVYAAMHARQLITFCEELTVEDEVWHRLHSFITGEDNRRAWTARLTMQSHRVLTARFAPLPDGSTMAVFADITESEHIAGALRLRNASSEIAETGRVAMVDSIETVLRPAVAGTGDTTPDAVGDTLETVARIANSRLMSQGYDTVRPAIDDCVAILGHRARQGGISLTSDSGAQTEDQMPSGQGQVVGQMMFNLVASALSQCSSGTEMVLDWNCDDERQGATLTARNSNTAVLVREIEDPADLVNDRLHLLATRCGALIEIEARDPAKLVMSCWLPSRTSIIDAHALEQDAAAVENGNVHELPRLGRG